MNRKTGMTTPDTGSWLYTYNNYGDMQTQTDANGNVTTYVYDVNGRLSKTQYQDGQTEFVYGTTGNLKGRLQQVRGISYTNSFIYDTLGNVITDTKRYEGVNYIMQYTYAFSGQQKSIIYPNNSQVHYTYNTTGDLIKTGSAAGSDQYIKEIKYNKDGQRTSITYGNNVTTTYSYDPQYLPGECRCDRCRLLYRAWSVCRRFC